MHPATASLRLQGFRKCPWWKHVDTMNGLRHSPSDRFGRAVRSLMGLAIAALCGIGHVPTPARADDPAVADADGATVSRGVDEDFRTVQETVETYCLDCHNRGDASGELDLESLSLDATLAGDPDWDTSEWEGMLRRLQGRQMPPPEAFRPSEAEYTEIVAAIDRVLDRHAQSSPRPGRTNSVRRLTRAEYRNAIRDLLAVDIDVESLLPPDPSAHGFDNITVAELSPTLLNRYIAAAEKISRLAVGRLPSGPTGVTVRVPADQTQEGHVEGLPLGTRGGAVVKHTFPRDGEYEVQLRLTRDRDERVEGLHESHHLDVLLDRRPVHQFTVEPPPGGKDFTQVDAHLQTRISVTAGPHHVGVTFPRKSSPLLETKRQPFHARYNRHRHPRLNPAIFEISIVGPFESDGPGQTPSRERIFVSAPQSEDEETACAEDICSHLMRLAYRRPITPEDLQVPMAFFEAARRDFGFEASIESALSSILVNPHFLFRVEQDPPDSESGDVYQISDLELASRMSFFLWSSLPDDELLSLAEAGRLSDEETLATQVRRMLRDERSESLVKNFASQWLYLRNLDSITPDLRLFPDFDDNLREAFRSETEWLFRSVLQDDRGVLDLIRTDHAYLNERLAKHYGVPHVYGSHFRRVELPPEGRRGGLLRQGSILLVTSYSTRTSPTVRGSWVLENIFGTPPPPPPPNVPSLEEKKTFTDLSVRERLAAHREDPACASCHRLMDPVGFALENFDAVGRWRTSEHGEPLDASGALPDGTTIEGIEELEEGILGRPEMFVGTLVEKLLTFALGRGIEPDDGPAVRQIVRRAADDDYRFSTLIEAIVSSPPFQMRSMP